MVSVALAPSELSLLSLFFDRRQFGSNGLANLATGHYTGWVVNKSSRVDAQHWNTVNTAPKQRRCWFWPVQNLTACHTTGTAGGTPLLIWFPKGCSFSVSERIKAALGFIPCIPLAGAGSARHVPGAATSSKYRFSILYARPYRHSQKLGVWQVWQLINLHPGPARAAKGHKKASTQTYLSNWH